MERPDRSFGFHIPVRLLEKLRYIADYECQTTSSIIRVLIEDYVEQFEGEYGVIGERQS